MKELNELKQRTIRGFNTWYNNSVLAHALLPEGIAVSLAFKFYNTGHVLKESLIGREEIHPGPRSYDGTYTELRLKHDGHELLIQSASVDENLYLLVTPIKTVTPARAGKPPALIVSASILWNKEGYVSLDNGRLVARTPGRILEFYVDGKPHHQLNTGITNPYLSSELSAPVAISTEKIANTKEISIIMEKQKKKILDECAKYGDLAEAYNAMRTCLAWDTIYEPENDQICSPVSRIWNIDWGGYVLFDWDTYFSALMAGMENKDLAYANVIAITREKTESGFIPNFGAADDNKSRDRSQPPVGSMTVLELYKKFREKWIVEFLFNDLLEWNRWFAHNRMCPNGQLCWGSNPFEAKSGRHWETEGVNDRFGAALESGLDNSPMYDDIPFNKTTHLMELADVGLTGLYIMDCEALAELADIIGRNDASGRCEASELRERAEKSKQGLEEMWDEDFGFYCNKRTDTNEFNHRISATNFYALFSDKVSKVRADRMIREHFFNRNEFYGEYIIPMCARNDPAYKDQDYWRGRIWAPTNFLAYLAMSRYGLDEPCKVLAEKSLNLIMKEWSEKGHVHENYNGSTGEGCDVKNSDKFYHWGGLLSYIALLQSGKKEPILEP